MTTEQIARAFSGHRFEETYDLIAADANWILVWHACLEGRDAIIDACRGTAADNVGGETTWLRFVSTGTGEFVAVDAICRYRGPGGGLHRAVVRHIDEFDGELITTITTYAVELPSNDIE